MLPRRYLLTGVVFALALGTVALPARPAQPAELSTPAAALAAARARPNLVVVMADDMRVGDLRFAPRLRRLVTKRGVVFKNSFANFPLCCPSRASFLTGSHAHNHHVWWHKPLGYGAFDDSRTLATSMRRVGYRTGYIGKYLNRYGPARSKVSGMPSYRYVPRGWDDWRASIDHIRRIHGGTYNYFDIAFNVNGRVDNRYRGKYSSNVIGDFSVKQARRFGRGRKPFFMYVNYVAPHHGGPREADDPRYETPARPRGVRGRFNNIITRGAGIARTGEPVEKNVSDKPGVISNLPRLTRAQRRDIRNMTRQRAEAVYVMDRNIARLIKQLKRSGEWRRTVFVFTSDNGYFQGEHRKPDGKVLAYEPSLRVPLLMTGPRLRGGGRRFDPVSTVDLSATLLDLADAAPPRRPDGKSRRATLYQGDQGWTVPVLTEAVHTAKGDDPRFRDRRSSIGLRVSRYSFTRYRSGRAELYDLVKDPRQDTNAIRNPDYAAVRRALGEVWLAVKDCRGAGCQTVLPPEIATGPAANRQNTAAYWRRIQAAYGF